MIKNKAIQWELDFWPNEKVKTNPDVTNVLNEESSKVRLLLGDRQIWIKYPLTHLFWWVEKLGEINWVTNYKVKKSAKITSFNWKVNLVWFWIRDGDRNKVRYLVIKIWSKNYKVNIAGYSFIVFEEKVYDWTAEWHEIWWIKLDKYSIESVQKQVWKGFWEAIKSLGYFKYLSPELSISSSNISNFLINTTRDFLKEIIKQI